MSQTAEQAIRASVKVFKPEKCDPSYILYNSRDLEQANLIDLEGNLLHSWAYPLGYSWHLAELLPNGHLGAIVKDVGGHTSGMYLELDWDGTLVRRLDVPAHHDFTYLSNGDLAVLTVEHITDERIYRSGEMESDTITRIAPDGTILDVWRAAEHAFELQAFVPVTFPRADYYWAHTNTIEELPDNPTARKDARFAQGNLLMSMRKMDTILILDRETWEIVWAWGPGTLDKQHMPTMLPNGNILVYDNGSGRGASRILEIDPLAGQIVWQYVADPPSSFYSFYRGSNQRLANGNTHISDADNGRLFEVTPDGETVWEFLTPDLKANGQRMELYRSMRYAPALVDPWLKGHTS